MRRSFEYTQHMFWMRNKGNNFPIRTLIWRPENVSNLAIFVAGHEPQRPVF